MDNIYIFSGLLKTLTTREGDLTGIPPGASLFSETAWSTLCSEAGGEAGLIASLGVDDIREAI